MKKQNLIMSGVILAILLSVSAVFAQDKKMDMSKMPKDEMNMAEMHKDGHHALMMAYQKNALSFTRALWDMTSDGKIENVDIARAAFAEIKRSMEKSEEVHQMHMKTMDKMDAAMMEKMKPMMDKMAAEKAALDMHIMMLDKALKANSPDAHEVEMHVSVLLLKLEKMNMPEKKMKISDQKSM